MHSPGNATKHLKKQHQFYTISSRKQKSKDLKYSKESWKRIKLENTLPDFKNCYKAIVINTGGFWQKDRHMKQNRDSGRPTNMWSADFWQWCKVNSMEMTQCFQQMILEQVDTCINHVPYFMTLFWHFKKLAGWGVTAPHKASQFLAWEHIFHMQFQLPHHLSLTKPIFSHAVYHSRACYQTTGDHPYTLKATGILFRIANPILLILPFIAFSLEPSIKGLYSACPSLPLCLTIPGISPMALCSIACLHLSTTLITESQHYSHLHKIRWI